MKITAKAYDTGGTTPPSLIMCGHELHIKGTVTPPSASKKVVLQRTVAGKWVDVKGWDDVDAFYEKPATLRQANVSQTSGAYKVTLFIDWIGSVRHYRIRSAGGSSISAGFYIEPDGWDGVCG